MFERVTRAIITAGRKHQLLLPLCILALCALFGMAAVIHAPTILWRRVAGYAAPRQAKNNYAPLVQRPVKRFVALLLTASLALGMTGNLARAADAGSSGTPAVPVSEPIAGAEPDTPADNAAADGEQGCTCPPADSIDGGQIVHGENCPLYTAPEQPAKPACTCPPAENGEAVHGPACPLYKTPDKPITQKCICDLPCAEGAANAECPVCVADWAKCGCIAPVAANAAAVACVLIDALPTTEELEAMDTEGARAAYNALSGEEKAAFAPARLEKLEMLEGLFSASMCRLRRTCHDGRCAGFPDTLPPHPRWPSP